MSFNDNLVKSRDKFIFELFDFFFNSVKTFGVIYVVAIAVWLMCVSALIKIERAHFL